MKVLFRNTTKYDKDNRNNFINFHNNKYGTKELIKGLLIAICILYIFIFNIIYKNWYLILALIIGGIFIYFIAKQKEEKKKKEQKKNKEFTFYFYERYIKIKCKRQFERMNYFEIKKIFETKENFFLYIDDNHSLILDKDGFDIGTSKDFTEFIKRKCPFKYSNK